MPAFETRTDSPGGSPEYPKIHVSTGEESSCSGPDFKKGLRPRHRRERNPERPPRNSHGDWPFLRPTERVPEGPVPRIDSHHVCTWDSPGGKPRGKDSRENHRSFAPCDGLRDTAATALEESPRIDSHHVGTWDSPVGKPRGKASRENHRSFDSRGGLRDIAATALEESASACPHSRRGLTPLGRLQKYPKIHVSTGEESSGSGPDSTQGLRPRHRRERNPERPPRNSHGNGPFLRPPERVPEVPVPRIDSHHVCTWDSPGGKPRGKDSRENHRSFAPCDGLRDTAATALEESGKNSRRSRRISRGGALHRKGERNSRVVPPFQESPRCDSPFQRNLFSLHCLDVQAEDRLPPRVHVEQPCGKASWERLVGKTRGKTIDPLIHAADCVTLLLPLCRKAQVHARIRDED
ncbi:hypothetical protein MJT46_017435 [Ovis ammon polii x Ovis aries]|nr:hypothetical protein MJT46_017435 [Ovis ammon polii x Ovis aries]